MGKRQAALEEQYFWDEGHRQIDEMAEKDQV